MPVVSIDCESTGLDLHHGALPFFVTWCEDGKADHVEFEVDPLTREVIADCEGIDRVCDVIDRADTLVLHNAKFDAAALTRLIPDFSFPWHKVEDTLIAAHLLDSLMSHSLDALAVRYLDTDIRRYEDALGRACNEARRYCRSKLKGWAISSEDRPDMPSLKSSGKAKKKEGDEAQKVWKSDTWLPKTLGRFLGHPDDHPWMTALETYADVDSITTYYLWEVMSGHIERRNLWAIYRERVKVLPVAFGMEYGGVTALAGNAASLRERLREESKGFARECVEVASGYGYELSLPKSGRNKSLDEFIFGVMGLEVLGLTEKGNPALDKEVLLRYELELDGEPQRFVKALRAKRKRDTTLQYLAGYERFWLPTETEGVYVLHPNLNPTGTNTLRWSHNNPNSANIQRGSKGPRSMFGPAPGREWWSMDGKNLELRIPAYESGEDELIGLFERPKEPPYFGSNHLLTFSTLYPDVWEEALVKFGPEKAGPWCKSPDGHESTYYVWSKNTNFAKQYGGQKATVDRTARKAGAYELLAARFARMETLNQKYIRMAQKMGYVETIPDREVDPRRGYPLVCEKTYGRKVLPTVPLNYHVQGTACWWMMKAMIRCQAKLDEWREKDGFDGRIVLQVHDELVFDFPRRGDPVAEARAERAGNKALFRTQKTSNLWRVRALQKLMERGGDDIGVPTPCSVELHREHWGEGVEV